MGESELGGESLRNKRLRAVSLAMTMYILLAMPLLTTTGSHFKAVGHQSTNLNLSQDSGVPYEGPDVLIQAGNSQPKFQFVPRSSDQVVADIRLGAGAYGSYTWGDLPHLDSLLNDFIEYGTWRLDTCVDEVEEPIYWEYNNEEEFPEEYDQFIDGLNENGVAVDYFLHFWDKTGHANGEELSTPRFQSEEQIQDFLDYVRFVVSHYTGRVQYYTIWSEPDNCPGIKCIKPEDYINLVRRTVPIIHEEDPQAKVSIAPNVLFFARGYLSQILESDIMTMVDVIQWHGIYNVLPNDPFYGDYYYQYPAIVEGIRETAAAHGFEGEYWATEISYSSEEYGEDPADSEWGVPSTDMQAAKYCLRAIAMHLGWDIGVAMSTWLPTVPETAPTTHRTTSNLYKVLVGARPMSLAFQIENKPGNTLNNTFKMPNGDTLLALWTHGEAVDDDPGVGTTLTFPSLSAQKVIAIDALNGFEQELIIEVENGNLVIRDIFVRDYPIILRILKPEATVVLIIGVGIIAAIIGVGVCLSRRLPIIIE